MLIIIRFWLFVVVMTALSFIVLRLIGRMVSLMRLFLFWIGVTLASVAVLYGFSLLVSGG